jgi:hypothetical protein
MHFSLQNVDMLTPATILIDENIKRIKFMVLRIPSLISQQPSI